MTVLITDIDTRRLKLREITEEDTEFIVMLRSNPEVYRYFSSVHKITAMEHIKWFRNQYLYDANRFDYIASIKEDNSSIGVFGIKRIEKDKDTAEISYILNQLYRGKGYAHEAVSALLTFIKKKWECKTAVAKIHKDNKPSIYFAENSGFNPVLQEENFITYIKQL